MPDINDNPQPLDSTDVMEEPVLIDSSNCDTSAISYSAFMVPLLTDHCLECHSGNAPFGGVSLDSYTGVKAVADKGRLYGAVSWQAGYEAMPQGRDKLSVCDLNAIKSWIDAGAENN